MIHSMGFSSASRRLPRFLDGAVESSGMGERTLPSSSRRSTAPAADAAARSVDEIGTLISLQRDEAFLLDDLLASRRKDPVDVSLDLPSRFAGGVEVELAGNRVLAVAGHVNARLDGRFTFFVRDFQPLHLGRLVTHAAIAEPGLSFGHVLD